MSPEIDFQTDDDYGLLISVSIIVSFLVFSLFLFFRSIASFLNDSSVSSRKSEVTSSGDDLSDPNKTSLTVDHGTNTDILICNDDCFPIRDNCHGPNRLASTIGHDAKTNIFLEQFSTNKEDNLQECIRYKNTLMATTESTPESESMSNEIQENISHTSADACANEALTVSLLSSPPSMKNMTPTQSNSLSLTSMKKTSDSATSNRKLRVAAVTNGSIPKINWDSSMSTSKTHVIGAHNRVASSTTSSMAQSPPTSTKFSAKSTTPRTSSPVKQLFREEKYLLTPSSIKKTSGSDSVIRHGDRNDDEISPQTRRRRSEHEQKLREQIFENFRREEEVKVLEEQKAAKAKDEAIARIPSAIARNEKRRAVSAERGRRVRMEAAAKSSIRSLEIKRVQDAKSVLMTRKDIIRALKVTEDKVKAVANRKGPIYECLRLSEADRVSSDASSASKLIRDRDKLFQKALIAIQVADASVQSTVDAPRCWTIEEEMKAATDVDRAERLARDFIHLADGTARAVHLAEREIQVAVNAHKAQSLLEQRESAMAEAKRAYQEANERLARLTQEAGIRLDDSTSRASGPVGPPDGPIVTSYPRDVSQTVPHYREPLSPPRSQSNLCYSSSNDSAVAAAVSSPHPSTFPELPIPRSQAHSRKKVSFSEALDVALVFSDLPPLAAGSQTSRGSSAAVVRKKTSSALGTTTPPKPHSSLTGVLVNRGNSNEKQEHLSETTTSHAVSEPAVQIPVPTNALIEKQETPESAVIVTADVSAAAKTDAPPPPATTAIVTSTGLSTELEVPVASPKADLTPPMSPTSAAMRSAIPIRERNAVIRNAITLQDALRQAVKEQGLALQAAAARGEESKQQEAVEEERLRLLAEVARVKAEADAEEARKMKASAWLAAETALANERNERTDMAKEEAEIRIAEELRLREIARAKIMKFEEDRAAAAANASESNSAPEWLSKLRKTSNTSPSVHISNTAENPNVTRDNADSEGSEVDTKSLRKTHVRIASAPAQPDLRKVNMVEELAEKLHHRRQSGETSAFVDKLNELEARRDTTSSSPGEVASKWGKLRAVAARPEVSPSLAATKSLPASPLWLTALRKSPKTRSKSEMLEVSADPSNHVEGKPGASPLTKASAGSMSSAPDSQIESVAIAAESSLTSATPSVPLTDLPFPSSASETVPATTPSPVPPTADKTLSESPLWLRYGLNTSTTPYIAIAAEVKSSPASLVPDKRLHVSPQPQQQEAGRQLLSSPLVQGSPSTASTNSAEKDSVWGRLRSAADKKTSIATPPSATDNPSATESPSSASVDSAVGWVEAAKERAYARASRAGVHSAKRQDDDISDVASGGSKAKKNA